MPGSLIGLGLAFLLDWWGVWRKQTNTLWDQARCRERDVFFWLTLPGRGTPGWSDPVPPHRPLWEGNGQSLSPVLSSVPDLGVYVFK